MVGEKRCCIIEKSKCFAAGRPGAKITLSRSRQARKVGKLKMNVEKSRIWTARLLIGFVLVTLGFAAGRRTAPMPVATERDEVLADSQAGVRVVVYAAHMTFRCTECSQIEWLARELVDSEFATELADGRLAFRTVDYMRDTALARKYNIAASTIVVTRMEDGVEKGFQRLDDVWTKVNDREAFFVYVRAAIRASLDKEDDA